MKAQTGAELDGLPRVFGLTRASRGLIQYLRETRRHESFPSLRGIPRRGLVSRRWMDPRTHARAGPNGKRGDALGDRSKRQSRLSVEDCVA